MDRKTARDIGASNAMLVEPSEHYMTADEAFVAQLENVLDTVRTLSGDDHCIRAAVEAFVYRAAAES